MLDSAIFRVFYEENVEYVTVLAPSGCAPEAVRRSLRRLLRGRRTMIRGNPSWAAMLVALAVGRPTHGLGDIFPGQHPSNASYRYAFDFYPCMSPPYLLITGHDRPTEKTSRVIYDGPFHSWAGREYSFTTPEGAPASGPPRTDRVANRAMRAAYKAQMYEIQARRARGEEIALTLEQKRLRDEIVAERQRDGWYSSVDPPPPVPDVMPAPEPRKRRRVWVDFTGVGK